LRGGSCVAKGNGRSKGRVEENVSLQNPGAQDIGRGADPRCDPTKR